MKPVTFAFVGLVFFGYCASAADAPSGPPPSGLVQQQRIATIGRPAEVLISDDLAHVAVIDQHGPKQRLTVDGKVMAESDVLQFVKHEGPLFDRGTPALYARADRGRWRLVVNGVTGPECDAWIDLTSSDAERTTIAYTAVEVSRKAFVAIDGQAGPTYADVSCLALSPDRTQIAYVACVGEGTLRKYIPVINGREGPEYDEIAIPSSGTWSLFSPDNKRTAYAARLGQKWRMVTDGRPGAEYDEIAPDSLAFSSDGRHIAYAARTGLQWCVVLDGRPGRRYDEIGPGPICFLANAKDLAYTALAGSQWLAIIGNQPSDSWDEVADLTVTPGGRHVAFVGRKGRKWRAIVDGNAGPEYDQIGQPGQERFWVSPDGKRLAYAGRLGSKWQVVVDGRPDAACDEIQQDGGIAFQQDGTPFYFSPNGTRTAYAARIGKKWSVVIDGKPGPSCDLIGTFEFSDDGARTAYAAQHGDKWQVVIDNRPGPKYDEVDASWRIFTLHGTRAVYAASREGKWRIVVNGAEGPNYDDVSDVMYSPDGRRMAYFAGHIVDDSSRDRSLVLDGQAGPWYRLSGDFGPGFGRGAHESSRWFSYRSDSADSKLALGHGNDYGGIFSQDGKHVACPAGNSGEMRIVHDGKPGPAYNQVDLPMFSSDGNRLAYVANVGDGNDGKQVVVIDGHAGPSYDEVAWPDGQGASCFSPDGKHTVYAAEKDGKWHAVVDGREGPACDRFFGPGASTSYGQPAAFASWRSVNWRGEKPYEYAPDNYSFSFQPLFFGAGGNHVAYIGIVQTQARAMVVANGVPGPRYEQVGKPAVSDDGRHVGYIACRGQSGDRKYVGVIDGREGPEFDEIPLNKGDLWAPFSSNGSHSAYRARAGAKWRAIVDGQPGPEYDEVCAVAAGYWPNLFSEDGSRVAYSARRGEKWRAVIDGREGPEFDGPKFGPYAYIRMTFSPDGKHVAYDAAQGNGPQYKYRVIIDGREGDAWPVFSPDSRRMAYVGMRGDKYFVVLDGKELAPHDSVDERRLTFSPDSRRLAYIAYRGKEGARKPHFVVDGQEGPEHGDSIQNIYFSPDSKHAAYIAINGRRQDQPLSEQMVVDGREGPVVENVIESSILWSSDGRHLAYVAQRGSATDPVDTREKWVILDGVAQAKYSHIGDLDFSADGKHLAYEADGCMVVRDGQPGPVFDEIASAGSSLFTSDGRHVLYQAKRGEKWAVVLDNQPGPEYDSVLDTWLQMKYWSSPPDELHAIRSPRILPDGAIQYPALTAGDPSELYIVTQRPATERATPPRER